MLFDDGAHGDGAAGDSVFGGYYETQPAGGTFVVDVGASDGALITEVDNIGNFTSLGPVRFHSAFVSAADTIPSPGDTFHLGVVLENGGSEIVRGVSAELTSLDPECSVLTGNVFYGDISPLDTASSSGFEVLFSLVCPHNEQVWLGLSIADSLEPQATWQDTFSIYCVDDEPPRLMYPRPTPTYLTEGDTVAILGRVVEGSGLNMVRATIENPVGMLVATIDLFDDGLHGDSLAGDGLYGNTWETPPWEQKFYNVNVSLEDGQANAIEHKHLMEFTTVPFVTSATILLVDDDNYNHPQIGDSTFCEEFYRQSLTANGYGYDYWDVYCYGPPDTTTLRPYEIVIWETGTTSDSFACLNDWDCSSSLSALEQDNLKAYLAGGGCVFISSQGIADFWEGPLRAMLRIQDLDYRVGRDTIDGVFSNPVGDGLSFTISGGDGADNQYAQAAINPMSLSYSALDYRGHPGGSAGTICEVASMWAAVTFGFGFEAISAGAERDTVMRRVVEWLRDPVAVDEGEIRSIPRRFVVREPSPNPCREVTAITFGLPHRDRVKVTVYNCAGQTVKTLLEGECPSGYTTVDWNCTDMSGKPIANGTYFCKIEAGTQRRTKKFVLVK
jgi:hypothetical protein